MASSGIVPGAAVLNAPPAADEYGLVVRVVGGGGGGGVVTQGTIPWICSDPILEAAIDVQLSSRASEATLLALSALVAAGIDVPLSTRASEATLATRLADATFTSRINTLGQKLMAGSTPVVIASDQSPIPVSLPAGPIVVDQGTSPWIVSDPPAEASLASIDISAAIIAANTAAIAASTASIDGNIDVALSTRASEATLATRASEATLAAVNANTTAIAGALDVALSTRASELTLAAVAAALDVTLSSRASEATLATRAAAAQLPAALVGGRLDVNTGAWLGSTAPTVGQKTMADSLPVTLASDQPGIPVTVSGTVVVDQGTSPWIVSDPPVEAALDVPLSSVATEATLVSIALILSNQSITLTSINNDTSTIVTNTGFASASLTSIDGKTPALGQTTMANSSPVVIASDQSAVPFSNANLDVPLSTRLADATFTGRINTQGQKVMAASTPVVLASDQSTVPTSNANLDVALSTRLADATFTARINTQGQKAMAASTPVVLASDQSSIPVTNANLDVALSTRLAEATFTARINTQGQKTMAASTPVVLPSDQSAISVNVSSTTGTLTNGAQTAVSAAAVSILAANANRKAAIVQNVGAQTVRIGVVGVTSNTGIQLVAGATAILEQPYTVTAELFAIRESSDSTVFATEIT